MRHSAARHAAGCRGRARACARWCPCTRALTLPLTLTAARATGARHAADPVALVRAQLTAALAALLKRGWADAPPAERRGFFEEVHAAADGGPPAARRAGLEILEARFQWFKQGKRFRSRVSLGW